MDGNRLCMRVFVLCSKRRSGPSNLMRRVALFRFVSTLRFYLIVEILGVSVDKNTKIMSNITQQTTRQREKYNASETYVRRGRRGIEKPPLDRCHREPR